MDHIDMKPGEAPEINWPELLIVAAMIGLILLAFGVAGRSDYRLALEQERNDLRVQLRAAQEQLRMANVTACSDTEGYYAQFAQAEVRP